MNKERLELDYFMDPALKLYQHKDHFRFNTDTKALARFMKIQKGDTVLDIGTNNGVLLRYADQFPVKKLIGVEVLQESFEVAQYNAETFFQHDYELIHAPIQEVQTDLVDVVISNPPFFPENAIHPDTVLDMRQLGRVEVNCSLEELCKNAARLLKSYGRFYLVHRPDRIQEIFVHLAENNFSVKTLQFVFDHRDQAVKSVLVEAVKDSGCRCRVLPYMEV